MQLCFVVYCSGLQFHGYLQLKDSASLGDLGPPGRGRLRGPWDCGAPGTAARQCGIGIWPIEEAPLAWRSPRERSPTGVAQSQVGAPHLLGEIPVARKKIDHKG